MSNDPTNRPENTGSAIYRRARDEQAGLGTSINNFLSDATDGRVTDWNGGIQSMFSSLNNILTLFYKAIFKPSEYNAQAMAMGIHKRDFGGDEMVYQARKARGEITVEEPEIDPDGTAQADAGIEITSEPLASNTSDSTSADAADPGENLDSIFESIHENAQTSAEPADRLESGALARIDSDGVRLSPALDAASAELNRQFAAAAAMPADPQPTAELTLNFAGPRVA